ncbi:hypothetical protein Aperf_G00000112095 [Anoplocephala perfoliata]
MLNGDDADTFTEEKRIFSRVLIVLAKRIMQNMDLHQEDCQKFMNKLNCLVKERGIDEEGEIRKFLPFLASNLQMEWKKCLESCLPQSLVREFDQSFRNLIQAPEEDNFDSPMFVDHLHGCLLKLVELYFPHLIPDVEIYQNLLDALQNPKNKNEVPQKNDDEFCIFCQSQNELQLNNENEEKPSHTEQDKERDSLYAAGTFDLEVERYLVFLEEQLYPKLTKLIYDSGDLEKFVFNTKENYTCEEEKHKYERSESSKYANESKDNVNVGVEQEEIAEAEGGTKAEKDVAEDEHILGENYCPEVTELILNLMKKVSPRLAEYAETSLKKIRANNQSDDANEGQEYSDFVEGVSNDPNDPLDIELMLNEAEDLIKNYREGNAAEQLKLFKQKFYPQLLVLWNKGKFNGSI